MNKKIMIVLLSTILVLSGLWFLEQKKKPEFNEIIIGILQTASFAPLDEAKEGFVKTLKNEYGDKIIFVEQNAQGSMSQAQAIASNFKTKNNFSAFYAIATPAAQALKSVSLTKPVLFSAITDPEGVHLSGHEANMTGASDMADIAKQIQIINQVMPNLKKVALLYNPAEPNSVILVKKMKSELDKYKISYQENGVNSPADVAAATTHAAKNSDLILIPSDVTVLTGLPVVIQITKKFNIPFVTTWTGEKEGPLMQFGVDYYQSGIQVARQLIDILKHNKNLKDIPVEMPSSKIFINEKQLKQYGFILPENLKKEVVFY